MRKTNFLSIVLFFLLTNSVKAQTIYVDAVKGRSDARGNITDPFSSLESAVALAGSFSGKEPIVIKVAPGLYTVQHIMELRTMHLLEDTLKYTIEATVMPDDPDWTPAKTPVIQSMSANNSVTQFTHCAAFLVARNNVAFRGLKFVGNANPSVQYYYPITRENENLKGLEVSQCYFVGEKNSSPIQGAIWAHGAGTHVDHCVFFGCKNALLMFRLIKGLSVTNSIIYGSYEAAVWFGPFDAPFVFKNNIVAHCFYFWLRPENTEPAYAFNNSMIVDNEHYLGFYTNKGMVEATKNAHTETDIRKTGKLILQEVNAEGVPKDYLNLAPGSDGKDLHAGIFKN